MVLATSLLPTVVFHQVNRINVWDPTNLSRIASYPAEECRWAISIVFSQDVNRDGREDMWVTDYGRSQIRCL